MTWNLCYTFDFQTTKDVMSNQNKLKPTHEQLEILKLFKETGKDTVKVNAVSGSGKTSSLLMLAEDNPKRSLYICFNKSNAEEATKRFPSHVTCCTTHSLAYNAVASHFGGMQKIRNRRNGFVAGKGYQNLCRTTKEIINYFSVKDFPASPAITATAFTAITKLALKNFKNSAETKVMNKHIPKKDFDELTAKHECDQEELKKAICNLAWKYWNELINPKSSIAIDDDTYLKLWCLTKPSLGYDIVYVDEAQDTNPAVLEVLSNQPESKMVFVGDSRQAIYAFRGAVNAMQTIKGHECCLSQSWRYGADIAAVAEAILDYEVKVVGNPSVCSSVVEEMQPRDKVTHLFRTNAMLLEKAWEYLEEGKEVGIGIAVASLTKYIESIIALKKGDRKNVKHDDVAKFPSWWEFVESTNEDKEAKRMLTLASKPNVNDFLQRIKTATNPEAQHFFMTAHKSKGFEWNNVQVYGDFRFNRHKEESNPLKGMPEQEVNLLYIACTRAKLKLKLPEELEFDFV